MSIACIEAGPEYSWGNDGYPRMYSQLRGNTTSAVTVLWENTNGPIPRGYEPDHKCRNIRCLNLLHVEIVTSAENNRRAHAKLTAEQVLEIRKKLNQGAKKMRLAEEYGVAYMTITFIERRMTWDHI